MKNLAGSFVMFALAVAAPLTGCGPKDGETRTLATSAKGQPATFASAEQHAAPAHEHAAGTQHAAPHWSYAGETGPDHWAELSPEFALAETGRQQSPIDLVGPAAEPADHGQPLVVDYKPTHVKLINNGHTIQEMEDPGSFLELDGVRFELKQFHFHSPSEHTVGGEHFPIEMHLVHADVEGHLGVIGVFIREGEANPAFETILHNLPMEVQTTIETCEGIDVEALLPVSRTHFRYDGSLTTPPCTEGVKWVVLSEPVTMSADQIARFREILRGNNRPVQPLNGRVLRISNAAT